MYGEDGLQWGNIFLEIPSSESDSESVWDLAYFVEIASHGAAQFGR